ncbi:MAG: 30S ribosomal protein S8e [Candidatus Aenigmarchaeota archaeon]|nr:30S ribosomal protein S8e [Candidatus Aenigmarchaeota archaeon]MCX8179551.1 30S ribosomal protein S8e [Candidatus Aenigmarchaeota archaeon]
MVLWNIDRGKKITGGRINLNRKKKKYQRGSSPTLATIGPTKKKVERRRGGIIKQRVVSVDYVNVINPKTNKAKKAKLIDVIEHQDNIHFTRRGIITKGCVVKTELGLVRITSRPSQDGVVNGVLIEKGK